MSYCDLCGGEIKTGDGGCVLHRDDPNKDPERFVSAINEDTYGDHLKLEQVSFPRMYPQYEWVNIIGTDRDNHFENCKFYSPININDEILNHTNLFRKCYFESNINIIITYFEKWLVFRDCEFNQDINLYELLTSEIIIDNPIISNNKKINIIMKYANIRKNLSFDGVGSSKLAFQGARIDFRHVTIASGGEVKMHYVDLSDCSFLGTNVAEIEYVGVKWCQVAPAKYNPLRRVGIRDEIESSDEGSSPAELRSGIEEVYRQLKVNYEAKGDYSRAGDFHIGEKEQRRLNPDTTSGLKSLLTAYKLLSGYGERPLMPFIWLVGLWLVTTLIYICLGAADPSTATSVGGGTVLLDSFRATFVPINPVQYEGLWVGWVSVVHRIFAGILLALLAFAIRQRVKR